MPSTRSSEFSRPRSRLPSRWRRSRRECATSSRPRGANKTFYRYFSGKNDLIAAVMECGVGIVCSYLEHRMAKETSPARAVAVWIEGMLAQVADPEMARASWAVDLIPGLIIEQTHRLFGAHRHEPGHSLVRYEDVRVPAEAMLGAPGHGFEVAQSRLAGGRLQHAVRAIGVAQRAIDMMAERANSRFTQGSALADKQFVQGFIAESYTELMPFRWRCCMRPGCSTLWANTAPAPRSRR